MAFFSESLALPENAFLILRDLIMERTGIYFEDNKKDILADKLSGRVLEKGFNSFLDYYYFLKYDSKGSDEWYRVFDLITVRETYFWREYEHIDALVNHILPEYYALNKTVPFRIWCAACSTGEEPLSIAMALDTSGWLRKLRIEIIASDASTEAVEKAKTGLYKDRSLRMLPEEMRKKYFTYEKNIWRINPAVRNMITWRQLNLVDDDERASIPHQDSIFCRNVFIYFREESIRNIVNSFFSMLNSPGYLFVGITESLFRITSIFELSELGKTFVYRKS